MRIPQIPEDDLDHAVDCDSQPGGRGRGYCTCGRAEVKRLRNIIGELYVQRGKDSSTLRNAIRRAFRDSGGSE